LNNGKTDVIWLGTRSRLQQLDAGVDLNLSAGSDIIKPSTILRDIGVFIDADLTFREHVICDVSAKSISTSTASS